MGKSLHRNHIKQFMADSVRLWMGAYKSISDTEHGISNFKMLGQCKKYEKASFMALQ